MRGRWLIVCSILLCFGALAACNQSVEDVTPESPTCAPAVVITDAPAEPEITASPEPTLAPTPAVYHAITGTVQVENLVLRKGPGFLFGTLAMYAEGKKVQVIGRSLGGDWLMVGTGDWLLGWMNGNYIKLDGEIKALPVYDFPSGRVIRGRVTTPDGKPVNGIGALAYPTASGPEVTSQHTVGNSDENGEFFIFLPAERSGDWHVELNAISCTSRIVDDKCNYNGSFSAAQVVTLPMAEGAWLEFQYIPK